LQNDDKNFWQMNSGLTEKTDIKESQSSYRAGRLDSAAPWADSFRGWILYDGNCRSCAASAKRFDRIFRRRGFLFLPLQTNWVMKRLHLEPGAPLEEMRVLTSDGRDIGGAEAVIFLGRQIWWAWPFVALARLPGMHKLLDRGYRWIAAHRGCDHIACDIKERRLPIRRQTKTAVERSPLLGFVFFTLPVLTLLVRDWVPPWVFMWLMVGAIFLACKWLTFSRARKQIVDVRLSRALGYFFLWSGMEAERFLGPPAFPDKRGNIGGAIAKVGLGGVLLFGLARFARQPLLTGWLGMIGIILILHFGIFALLGIAWRAHGIDARPIMDSPLKSITLGEFWGRRWNGAFNQLAFEILFQPLARTAGPIISTMVAFLASGLIHELVISLPARAGYGLPAAYFLLQGCGLVIQHRLASIRRGMAGRFFTILVVAGPAFWLFHPPFVRNVILPFMKAIGAL
jgi:predicted DCC family thiol-disulfide oxidoreductase YuxK